MKKVLALMAFGFLAIGFGTTGCSERTPTSPATEIQRFRALDAVTTQTIFGDQVPSSIADFDTAPTEVGVKFQSSIDGTIQAVRFYRGVANPAGYRVRIWDTSGNLLGSGNVVEGQSPVPCWQRVDIFPAVAINANTTYIASYYSSRGGYAYEYNGLSSAVTNGNLTALASNASGGNGVYKYADNGGFPSDSYRDSNYFVDVVFTPSAATPTPTPVIASNIFGSQVPGNTATFDSQPVVLGVKFQSSVSGYIKGVRFYRSVENGAGYRVHIWDTNGNPLGSGNVVEGQGPVPGWQEVQLYPAVPIQANTTYTASYYSSNGGYSFDYYGLNNAVTNANLTAVAGSSAGGNGVYRYGASIGFPTESYQNSNYWVDIHFSTQP